MRISISFFLGVFVVVNLSSCKKQQDDPDGKYTVSGRLFAGTSDEPLANVPVELEGQREVAISKTEVYALGSTTTDASGFFSIAYDQTHEDGAVKFENGNFVLLRTVQQVGGLIESLPWNTNVQRDFAQVDHSRLVVSVTFLGQASDSIYVMLPSIIGDTQLVYISAPEVAPGQTYPAIAVPVDNSPLIIERKIGLGGSWDNKANRFYYAYGTSYSDMHRATISNFVDSIPDFYNTGELYLRGFPKTDTLNIQIP